MRLRAVIVVALLIVSGCVSPKNPPQKPLQVSLKVWVLSGEGSVDPNYKIYAPVNILLGAQFSTAASMQAGDVVTVDFFANDKKLGSRNSEWSDVMAFDPALMKWTVRGFYGVALEWSNVPPANYVLTARASVRNGPSGASTPFKIEILPSPIRRTAGGR
jgi:hypothetical protein